MTTALDLNWYERDSVVDFKRYFLEMAIKCSTTRERVIKEVAEFIRTVADNCEQIGRDGNASLSYCEMGSNFWIDFDASISYEAVYSYGDYYTPSDCEVTPIYSSLSISRLTLYSTISDEYEIDLCEIFNISEDDIKLCKR